MLCKGVLPNCMLVFSGPNVVLVCFRPFGDDEYVTVHSKMTERLTVPAKNILCGDIEGVSTSLGTFSVPSQDLLLLLLLLLLVIPTLEVFSHRLEITFWGKWLQE